MDRALSKRDGFPGGVSISRDPGPIRRMRPTRIWSAHPGRTFTAPIVACVPVFNAADQLPEALESLEGAVDAVIALNHGSLADSREILRGPPLGIGDVAGYCRERFDTLVRKSILRRPGD